MRLLLSFVLLLLITLSNASHSAERYALVIGNSDYKTAQLVNPRNDALDIAVELKKLGYKVHKNRALLNLDRQSFENELLNYVLSLPPKAISLVYYAGHGVATGKDNYLIPVGADLLYDEQLPDRAVSLRSTIALVKNHNPDGFNITLLDACRDNPLIRQSSRSTKLGLNRLGDVPRGSFIGYAADFGQVAEDGFGRNGVYTSELLYSLRSDPDKPIESVHKEIAARVVKRTNSEQFPVSEQKFIGTYCFGECQQSSAKTNPPPVTPTENTTVVDNNKPERKGMSVLRKSMYVVGAIALIGLASLASGGDSEQTVYTVNISPL